MPFKSDAQRRKFHSDPKLHQYIDEFEADTPASLPDRVGPPRSEGKRRVRTARRTALGQMLAQTRSVHR